MTPMENAKLKDQPAKAPFALILAIVAALTMTSATPAEAGFGCWLWGCGSEEEEEEEEVAEDVAPTGVIHPIYMVGDAFFPDIVHAQPGDAILFYNLANTSQRVKADDNSWQSDYLSYHQSWSMIVQANTELEFRKSSYYGSFYGEIKLENVPDEVNFGDLIDGYGEIIGKDGVVVATADGLGYTLAAVGGLVQDVAGAAGDLLGGVLGGNGLGLTEDLGVGNNIGN